MFNGRCQKGSQRAAKDFVMLEVALGEGKDGGSN